MGFLGRGKCFFAQMMDMIVLVFLSFLKNGME